MADILTISQAGYLADLIRGVESTAPLEYYQYGAESHDKPLKVLLRAFTTKEGYLYPHDADIRDAYVWTSGTFEHWFNVRELMTALENAVHGNKGTDQPMAIIRRESQSDA